MQDDQNKGGSDPAAPLAGVNDTTATTATTQTTTEPVNAGLGEMPAAAPNPMPANPIGEEHPVEPSAPLGEPVASVPAASEPVEPTAMPGASVPAPITEEQPEGGDTNSGGAPAA